MESQDEATLGDHEGSSTTAVEPRCDLEEGEDIQSEQ